MVRRQTKIELYTFSNIPIKLIEDTCIEELSQDKTIVNINPEDIRCDDTCPFPIETVIKEGIKPHRLVLHHKIIFIVDLIIRCCMASKNNSIQLHSTRLQDVIGTEYRVILNSLCKLNLICLTSTYIIGKQCRLISLINWKIEKNIYPNLKVIEYKKKWHKLVEKNKADHKQDIDLVIKFIDGKVTIEKRTEPSISDAEAIFYKRYNSSLATLNLKVDKKEALKYVDSLFTNFENHSYHYYRNMIETFEKGNNQIQSIDEQNRIYHYLTSLPKKLKCLFNIKYQLDIANSHPLLFCKYLIYYYKIDNNILNILYNIDIEEYNNNIHNVIKNIHNKLNISNLHVPDDIIKYIYVCSKGLLWDDFAKLSDFSRDEVKVESFKTIFYPHKNIAKYSEFGRKFLEIYPSVYKVISDLKGKTKLPTLMMKFESRLMRRTLNECYSEGYNVVNIHDAIIVIDDGSDTKADDIKNIMFKVYNSVMLNPTIHEE